MLLCNSKVIIANVFPTINSTNMYFKVGKICFVNNNEKKLKNDFLYNFTEITESSRRIFRNVNHMFDCLLFSS